jgi:plastocyanin
VCEASAVRKLPCLVVIALVALVALSPPAGAATKNVTISNGNLPGMAKLSPDPVSIDEGDTITFKNNASSAFAVCLTSTNAQLTFVAANESQETVPFASGTVGYYLAASDCSPDAVKAASGTIDVKPAPTTTTTEPPVTTTTEPATTTTTKATTTTTASTTTSTSSTTSTTSTSTTTTAPKVVVADKGSSSSNTGLLLAIAAAVVAALAGLSFLAYRRSQEPPYDDPEGWEDPDDWTDEPPPTQMGPTV